MPVVATMILFIPLAVDFNSHLQNLTLLWLIQAKTSFGLAYHYKVNMAALLLFQKVYNGTELLISGKW
jgi:hypothetical protein